MDGIGRNVAERQEKHPRIRTPRRKSLYTHCELRRKNAARDKSVTLTMAGNVTDITHNRTYFRKNAKKYITLFA